MEDYKYTTPKDAVISLEKAYTHKSLEAVLYSKDFKAEALLILEQAEYKYDLTDQTIIDETAKLLELALIQSLNENGFPSFKDVEREFSELVKVSDNIYCVEEKLLFPDNKKYVNKIFLSCRDSVWKVAMVEE